MYWFKNAMIYRLTKSLNLDDLQDKLNYAVFTPCEPSDSTHFGWATHLKIVDCYTTQQAETCF